MSGRKSIVLGAGSLIAAMRSHVKWSLHPESERPAPVKLHLARGFDVSPVKFWYRLGLTVPLRHKGERIQVQVPNLLQVQRALYTLQPEKLRLGERILVSVSPHLFETRWSESLRYFEGLSPEEQRPIVEQLSELAALEIIYFDISTRLGPLYTELRARLPLHDPNRFALEEEHRKSEIDHAVTMERIYGIVSYLDLFYWEELVCPTEGVQRFLPPGSWPKEFAEDSLQGIETPELALGDEEVHRSDSRIDTARFDFYVKELGCKRVVEPLGWFKDRNYVAFLLRTASGQQVAFLDCATVGNAAYVFVIGGRDDPDQTAWSRDAQKTKHELLSGGGPTFDRRFIHVKNWREHVRRYLSGR